MAALRDAVVDLAARRQMLLVRAKARIAAQQFAEAEQAIKQLRELPAAQDLVAARIAEAKKDLYRRCGVAGPAGRGPGRFSAGPGHAVRRQGDR